MEGRHLGRECLLQIVTVSSRRSHRSSRLSFLARANVNFHTANVFHYDNAAVLERAMKLAESADMHFLHEEILGAKKVFDLNDTGRIDWCLQVSV